ncbi:MAG: energy transducer TonB [Verrucomicrobiae bacterium]|nr:energy transducer TonB [Verrucomicrobiae bacterium]
MVPPMQDDGSDICFSYPEGQKRPTKLIGASAMVVALGVFFTVPFTSFIFPTARKGSTDEVRYVAEALPPELPELPPRLFQETEMLDMRESEIPILAVEDLDIPISPVAIALEAVVPEVQLDLDLLNFETPDDFLSAYASDEVDRKPRIVFQPEPKYPEYLRKKGIVGEVWVQFIVDEKGKVRRPYVTKSTNDAFNRAAIESIAESEFEPGLKSGMAVKTHVLQPIKFSLRIQTER